jgi:hypothetical protein
MYDLEPRAFAGDKMSLQSWERNLATRLLFAIFLVPATAQAACTVQTLVEPAKGQVLQHRQPTLRWGGKSSDTFRLQVAALLPEARILASYDVMVSGTEFTLPAALPFERAAVKVLISQGCDALEAQDLHGQGAWFFVDLRGGCSIERQSFDYRRGQLTWKSVAAARSYKVRLFKGEDQSGAAAVPLQEIFSAEPEVSFPGLGTRGRHDDLIATVQPVCEGLPGRAVAFRLPSD